MSIVAGHIVYRSVGGPLATEFGGRLGSWDFDVLNDRLFMCPNGAGFFGIGRIEAANGVPLTRATDVIHPEDSQRVMEAIGKTCAEGGRYEQTYRIARTEGRSRAVHAFGACVKDDEGRPIRFPGVLLDISDNSEALPISAFDIACDHLLAAREAAVRSGDETLTFLCEAALRHIAEASVSSAFTIC